jgi:WD40 repeat protein
LEVLSIAKKKSKLIEGHNKTVTLLRANKAQTLVGSASADGVVLVWKVDDLDLTLRLTLYGFTSEILDIWFSGDGSNLMAVGSQEGKVCLYNSFNGSVLRTMFHPARLSIDRVLVSLSPLAVITLFSQADNTIHFFSINGQLLNTHKPQATRVTAIEFGTDSNFFDFLVSLL